MKVICKYCDGYLLDTDEVCPHCAAPNEYLMRSADGIPKTIEQLKAFAVSKNLPLQQMRFFLGVDMREPRAFGIYKDEEDNFIVYKNKSNGERVIRYRGKDEAYAVNELYQKMKTEVVEQKAHQAQNMSMDQQKYQYHKNFQSDLRTQRQQNVSNTSKRNSTKSSLITILIIIIAIIVISRMIGGVGFIGSSGYHNHNYGSGGGYYYDYGDNNDDWNDDDDSGWFSDDDWDDDWDDDDWDFGGGWDSDTDWDSDW